ncbi:MAG: MarC family protein [Candidatus Kapaibacteriota bacterium]|jgi:multiple antibiotic resistance protein
MKFTNEIIQFLVMINPFALFLYLNPLMAKLSNKDFIKVLVKASLISFLTYIIFLLAGDFIFSQIFQIDYEAFRVFGGIVIFSFAYIYIVKGGRAILEDNGNLNDLAATIAMPFMVGAGTISLSIIMGKNYPYYIGVGIITASVIFSFGFILLLKKLKDILPENAKIAFDKNMEVLLRLNGFFVGAIGINMMFTGIKRIFGL